MKWLLWREYRLNRLIVFTGAGLFLLPYVFVFIGIWWSKINISSTGVEFAAAVIYSIGLSQLTVALLGGNAIAGERADRSAEFMAYLPVTRTRRLTSKLILAISVIVVIWGINLFIYAILKSQAPRWANVEKDMPYILVYLAISGVMIFGVAWFISSLGSSPTFAVCAGLIAPLLIVMGLQLSAWAFEAPMLTEHRGFYYSLICGPLGIAGFTAGTWYYLTRVEP